MRIRENRNTGFTIVELLIVVVIIAILAAIAIVSYNGILRTARESSVKSELAQVQKKVTSYAADNLDALPSDLETVGFVSDDEILYEYTVDNTPTTRSYCASVTQFGISFHVSTSSSSPVAGLCPGHTGGVGGPWTALSAGSNVTCGVSEGKAYCWGYGSQGRLGNGSAANVNVPTAVTATGVLSGKTVTNVAVGQGHACAIADGQAYCWGLNTYGQLGNNSTSNSSVPVAVNTAGVLAGKTVTAISAAANHTCAIASGQAYCWGENTYGRLGDNSTTNSSVPVAVNTSDVLAGRTVTSIAAGAGSHTCAVADGAAYCWGRGLYGRLGNNSTATSLVPVAVNTSGVLGGKTATAVAANGSHSCALASSQIFCWGLNGTNGVMGVNDATNSTYQLPVAPDTSGALAGKSITSIGAGSDHVCAVGSGSAYCWGANGAGQLGNNSTTVSRVPVAVSTTGVLSGRTVDRISVGAYHACVLSTGEIYCWGDGSYGELGNGSSAVSTIPVKTTNP